MAKSSPRARKLVSTAIKTLALTLTTTKAPPDAFMKAARMVLRKEFQDAASRKKTKSEKRVRFELAPSTQTVTNEAASPPDCAASIPILTQPDVEFDPEDPEGSERRWNDALTVSLPSASAPKTSPKQ